MEMVWLAITVVTAIIAGMVIKDHGVEQATWYIVMPIAAFLFYLLRRNARKRVEKNERENKLR